MSDAIEATLFEADASSGAAGGVGEAAGIDAPRVLFVTNRYNLLEFLSAGMILPRTAIVKYYADLLDVRPGRVPLLEGSADTSLIEAVEAEDESAFAVILDVDGTRLKATDFPSVGHDGRAPLSQPGAKVWAPSGVLPLGAVTKIHFKSDRDLAEHSAREYENIASTIPCVVTPELFVGGSVTLDQLRVFLSTLPEVTPGLGPVLEQADRTTGSQTLMMNAAPADVPTLRQLVKLVVGHPGPKSSTSNSQLPSWLTPEVLAGTSANAKGADAVLFCVCCAVLREVDQLTTWRPLEILRQIEEMLETRPLGKAAAELVRRNLRPIASILKNERDFKPFEPGSGLNAAKALLMVLLRPEPSRLLSWDRTESGADDVVRMLAAALVGLLRGRQKLSIEFRGAAMDAFLADRVAVVVADLDSDAPKAAVSGEISVEATDASVNVILGQTVLLTRTPAASPASLLERLRQLNLARAPERSLAVSLAVELGWQDCIETVISATGCVVETNVKGRAIGFRFPGMVTPEYVLIDDQFSAKLAGTSSFSDDVTDDYLSRIARIATG